MLSASLLVWLRAFDAAARHNSFTLAAEELHVTQGAISQQVKHLEDWLGTPLFQRGKRQLVLLPHGVRLKVAVMESFQILEQVVTSMRPPARQPVLRLNCSPSFAMQWITPRIGDVLAENPDLSLRVFGEFHALNRSRMTQEHIEAAVRFDLGGYEDVRAVSFLDEWLLPVASPEFLAGHPEIREPEDIPVALMLHDELPWDSAADHEEWNRWLRLAGAPVPDVHTGQHFNLSLLAVNAAISGQGIAIGRMAIVMDALTSGRLVPVLPVAVAAGASYHYVSLDAGNARVAAVERWLKQESVAFLRQRQDWFRRNKVVQRKGSGKASLSAA
ncbi:MULTISPECIES: LysR family transcriptional regulator [unclassified Achromobacter]|uniref:LysR family transcriptional regulator n=1 Tax=unclassified Achromobacter TaxID=2626865 RepID=UPI000B515AD5|nr:MULTISPECIES: LysR family transcriptional regulator [unclassified Achromobacter]OWT68246.1 LysR family transcriptional regulator [Achromobacter sp. HZ34]OWT70083.1 LysR family transcriptional regulator [Achromobacter sp. HZ28]